MPVDHPRPIELFGFVTGKLCFLLTLVAPLLLCDTWAIGFRQMFLMVYIGSFFVILTFAVSHQNRKCFQAEEALEARGVDGNPATDFGELQVETTCNFYAPFWQLLHCAGLGFQVEHHLFPTVSICHFPEVSKIVMQPCAYPPRPLYAKRWKADDILYPRHEEIRGKVDPLTGFSAELKYLPGESALRPPSKRD